MIEASAPELAFYAARVGLTAGLLHPQLQVAIENGAPVTVAEAIGALTAANKPIRITGTVDNSLFRIRLTAIDSDPDTIKRFEIRRRNLATRRLCLTPRAPTILL